MSMQSPTIRRALQLAREGRVPAAEALLEKQLARRPDDAATIYTLALIKAETGRLAEAHFLVAEALQHDGRLLSALVLCGRLEEALGDPEKALSRIREALAIDPACDEALVAEASLLRQRGDLEMARRRYEAGYRLVITRPDLLCNFGNLLAALDQPEPALQQFDRAIALQPGAALFHYNRGNVLMRLMRYREAIAAFDAALKLEARHADAWNNRGNALLESGDIDAALKSFDQALSIDPAFPDALVNKGHALLESARVDEALTCFRDAQRLDAESTAAADGLGMAQQRLGQWDAAVASFNLAIRLDPSFPEARYNRALLGLFLQEHGPAWDGYEARFQVPVAMRALRKDSRSLAAFGASRPWQGPGDTTLARVAVWAEQGIGDQILFSTLLPDLCEAVHGVSCEVDSRLIAAYRRAFPGVAFVPLTDPPGDSLLDADSHVAMASLPRYFRRDAAAYSRQPQRVLAADPDRVAVYAGALGEGHRVALSWRSFRRGWAGQEKSAGLTDFVSLAGLPGMSWVDVQYGDTAVERAEAAEQGLSLCHFDNLNYRDDLEDLLAILSLCDLLITTSNASAHLAAALGKPVWLIFPGNRPPFHYWVPDADGRCRWYPSVEIVSDSAPGWQPLIARLRARLVERYG